MGMHAIDDLGHGVNDQIHSVLVGRDGRWSEPTVAAAHAIAVDHELTDEEWVLVLDRIELSVRVNLPQAPSEQEPGSCERLRIISQN